MDGARGDRWHVTKEQVAGAPGEEVARVSRCGRFSAAQGTESAAACDLTNFVVGCEVSARWCPSTQVRCRPPQGISRVGSSKGFWPKMALLSVFVFGRGSV